MSRPDDDHSAAFGDRGENAVLAEFLGYKREAIIKKVVDLPDEVAHRVGVASGTSLAWLIKHLTASERLWFGGATVDEWEALSILDANETVADLVADYRRATQESDAIIAGWTDLAQVIDELPSARPPATARWIMQHLISETARHAGHADILREQIDGAVGR